MTDYVTKVTSRLEAPMRGLFIYRKGYFHSMEVLNRLYEDQGLRSESVQPIETRDESKTYALLFRAKRMIGDRG